MADAVIPSQIADIDVAWLNSVLGDEVGTIEAIEVERFGEGVGILGELARLTLTYAAGHSGPDTIVAKCASAAEENHFLAVAMGFYTREVAFYQQVANEIDLPVPHGYYAASSESGVPFVLLIEDIRGAATPDQLAGLSVADVKRIVSTIAPLHTRFWGDMAALAKLSWLPPMNNDMYKGGQPMATGLFPAFAEHYASHLPSDMVRQIGVSCERYTEILDFVTTVGSPTFTHTDCRAENYLFGRDGDASTTTVVDFQLSTRHIGMWDVANLVAGSMETELRRAHEAEILQHYVDLVTAAGIEYSLDQAMYEYRVCLLQQCPAQVITSDLQGGNDRGAQLLEALHLRPPFAALDTDALALLDDF